MRCARMLESAVVAVAAVCVGASFVSAQVPVGTFRYDASAFVVLDNGDVYQSDIAGANTTGPHPQGPWALLCNIFSAGGPLAPVVGVGGEFILTASGGVYRVTTVPPGAILDSIINGPPGESFVALGTQLGIGTSLCYVYAVTNRGSVYRGCAGGWEFVGTLPIGPTPSQRTTWGDLKQHYR